MKARIVDPKDARRIVPDLVERKGRIVPVSARNRRTIHPELWCEKHQIHYATVDGKCPLEAPIMADLKTYDITIKIDFEGAYITLTFQAKTDAQADAVAEAVANGRQYTVKKGESVPTYQVTIDTEIPGVQVIHNYGAPSIAVLTPLVAHAAGGRPYTIVQKTGVDL